MGDPARAGWFLAAVWALVLIVAFVVHPGTDNIATGFLADPIKIQVCTRKWTSRKEHQETVIGVLNPVSLYGKVNQRVGAADKRLFH